MSLKDVEDKLYDPNSDLESREHSKSIFDADGETKVEGKFEEKKTNWENFSSRWLDDQKRLAIYVSAVVLGVIVFGILLIFAIGKFKESAFSEKNVTVSVEGPISIDSAKEAKYIIRYKNKNRVSLKNADLILNHSENFYPDETNELKKVTDRSSRLKIDEIGPFGGGKIEISGKFYASENYLVYLQPVLKYQPSNFSSYFEATSQTGVKITSSPMNLTINAPREALDESSVEYEFFYENKGSQNLDNLNLKLEYSEGFTFQSGIPAPVSGENIWHIGDLKVGESGKIKVKGQVDGEQYDTKLIKAVIYKNEVNNAEIVYGKAEGVTKIVVPPLAVSHKLNGKNSANVNLGDSLNYVINYSNRGDIGLKDVVVKLKIDSPVINYEKLDLREGAYNSKSKDITWKASDISQLQKLEPGNVGQIELTIPLKQRLEISSFEQKNFIIESVATIDSSDVAFQSLGNSKNISNTIVAKLNSKIILESRVYFKDGDIENFGPIPQKVGEETTYTVEWKVANVSNNISDVKVSAFLPTWINWKGLVVPEDKKVSFNERTHEIIWEIGQMQNGKGILNEPEMVKFQIGLVPEVNQVGEVVKLIYETKVTGRDDFTQDSFNWKTGDNNINLEEFANSQIYGNFITK